jgi:hypothetical protein
LLGCSKDCMLERAHSKDWRWRLGRFYERAHVVVYLVCQSVNATVRRDSASLPEPSGCFAPASQ